MVAFAVGFDPKLTVSYFSQPKSKTKNLDTHMHLGYMCHFSDAILYNRGIFKYAVVTVSIYNLQSVFLCANL